MEQTLGKRIVSHRKAMGLTQDQLAEKLGVTAQAVSKWENDQSCPDINILPKLAGIFGCTTDALLGVAPQQANPPQPAKESDPQTPQTPKSKWEFRWDAGRKPYLGFALWVLLVGGLLLASNLLHWEAGLWDIAWPSGLLIFGLWGLVPKFSFFQLGCACFGGWYLLVNLDLAPFSLGKELLLPICILLFGLSLLVDALGKKKKPSFRILHTDGDDTQEERKHSASLEQQGETFRSSSTFGEDTHVIDLPTLRQGEASVKFGELTVDLSGCQEVTEDCHILADCSFGVLTFLIPRKFRVLPTPHNCFSSLEITGSPDPEPQGTIQMDCRIAFGEIEIKYV